MATIQACELPEDALLRRYLGGGSYADCYATEFAGQVAQAEFVTAFYTTKVFKLERLLLSWLARRPSSDAEVLDMAGGKLASFAAWDVEAREPRQLLLRDFQGRTRSWLMTVPEPGGHTTRLFFGSAVVPVTDRRPGKKNMGLAFRALLGFHKLYSRILLRAAVRHLAQSTPGRP